MAGDERISELDAKTTLGAADLFAIMDEAAAPDQTKKITWANLQNAIRKIQDADADTKWQMEESADEDIARLDIAGTERMSMGDAIANITANHWLFGSDAGIISCPKQSACALTNSAHQPIKTNIYPHSVAFQTAIYDIQNEASLCTNKTATAGTTGTDLYDSTNPFVAGDVGKYVYNLTDGWFTTIAAYVGVNRVTLTADIDLDNTDSYSFGLSRITVTEPGKYACVGAAYWIACAADKTYSIYIYRNGSNRAIFGLAPGAAGDMVLQVSAVLNLSANDYIELKCNHNTGSVKQIKSAVTYTSLTVVKIA